MAADILVPLPKTEAGNTYVLVVGDTLLIGGGPNQKASTVARKLTHYCNKNFRFVSTHASALSYFGCSSLQVPLPQSHVAICDNYIHSPLVSRGGGLWKSGYTIHLLLQTVV